MAKFDDILFQPVNLQKLVDSLEFDPDELEEAARRQPKLFLEAGRYRTLKLRRRLRAEIKLDLVQAEAALRFRERKREEKTTEGEIKNKVANHSLVRKWQRKVQQSLVQEKYSEMLLDAYKHRKDMVIVLGKLRNDEISAEVRAIKERMAQGEMHKLKEKVRKRFPGVGV